MPKQVTLKSGEVVTAYDYDEFIKVTDEDIEAQALVLSEKLKKAHKDQPAYA